MLAALRDPGGRREIARLRRELREMEEVADGALDALAAAAGRNALAVGESDEVETTYRGEPPEAWL